MDKTERTMRRAKDAIIQLLIMLEQPMSDEDAIESLEEWERRPYHKLLETVEYNLKRELAVNVGQVWYVNLCIQLAEQVRVSKQKEVVHA